MGTCSKCSKQVKTSDLKICSKCGAHFHYQCLSITAENFSKESKAHKATWKCPNCKSSESQNKSITPPLSKTSVQVSDSPILDNNEDLKQYIEKKLDETFARLLSEIKRDLSAESCDTRSKIQELTESVNYMTDKCDALQKSLETEIKKVGDLELENKALKSQVSYLSNRLDDFEQHSRDCNLDIQCVPERKSENLREIVHQLTATVGYQLPDHELLNYHRVAKFNQDSNRPRSIIVKLCSPLVRDKIIAAVKIFNKSHPSDKLNSAHLGVGGKDNPVYVCEHLSPANKQLHAAARKTAKEKKFQFVWVRNGRIFMRKDANSKSFAVKDLDVLDHL